MINKLFFENISGLLRIFTNKNVNFKLIISPIETEKDNKIIKNKITYNFKKNILNFPNNIKQILTEFSFLKKNLDYHFFINKNLKFILEISDGFIILSESIIINYFDIANLETNIEKYNSNKKKINYNDDDINELMEFYINNKNENNEDDFIFTLE
jgi:hypothetical protein